MHSSIMKKGFVLLLALAFVCIVFAEDKPTKCPRGNSWSDGCNDCFCTEEGGEACTQKDCKTVTLKPVVELEEAPESCTPGSSFKIDCNNCRCAENGKPFCTRKLCRSSAK